MELRMTENRSSSSGRSSTSTNSIADETEDDHTIAQLLADADEDKFPGNQLTKRLSHLDSIPVEKVCFVGPHLRRKRCTQKFEATQLLNCYLRQLDTNCTTLTISANLLHTPRIISDIPNANDASFDHGRLSERLTTYGLAELQIEGDGNCQFRALADQLFHNPDYHGHVRKEIVKQLKSFRNLYEGYVPMKYRRYLRKMKRAGEWGDHVTLQAASDRFAAKICLVTSFRDTCYIEILPYDKKFHKEIWLSFWSEVHYNSLYDSGDVPTRVPRKKYWLF